jgi:23S rRNA pseudouridine1911/1915/1917 synthase
VTRQHLTVGEGAATERLDVYLAAALDVTRSQAHRLITGGHVQVNEGTEKPSYLIVAGDLVEVEIPQVSVAQGEAPDLPIVYEDDDILVVDKPAGIAAHHGSGTAGQATLADFARQHTTDPDPDRPGIVHRLDRDTSGLIVIAKTAEAKLVMQAQFAGRSVHKTYRLLAVGRISPAEAIIRLPLDRDPAHPLKRAVVASGREAVTHYRTVANYPGYTLVEAQPETGRTHQIRVHFAALGHPVAGDTLYGAPVHALGLKRHFLHAAALEFTTPSGEHLRLTSDLPPDLAKVLRGLDVESIN